MFFVSQYHFTSICRVVSIGVGADLDQETLEIIASDSVTHFFTVLELSQLNSMVDKVIKVTLCYIRSQYHCYVWVSNKSLNTIYLNVTSKMTTHSPWLFRLK